MFNKSKLVAAAAIAMSVVTFANVASAATTAPASTGGQPPTHYTPNDKFDSSTFNEDDVLRRKHRKPHYRKLQLFKSDIEISCKEGRLIVARQGFENVHTLKCQGRNFSYVAMLDGEVLRVDVNRRGDIVGATHF